jgi:hypothetical protein
MILRFFTLPQKFLTSAFGAQNVVLLCKLTGWIVGNTMTPIRADFELVRVGIAPMATVGETASSCDNMSLA